MSSLHYSVSRTFLSGTLSWFIYLTILGIVLQFSVSGKELKSNTIKDFDEDFNNDGCPKETLEEQAERANIIFTGTVQDVFSYPKHISYTKARVEVKRILKGRIADEFVLGFTPRNLKVIVDGLGNPRICHSSAKPSDTRIFLVNENGNELKLNSSLVRISLSNLNCIEAAVKNEVIVLKPEDPADPCTIVFCAFHALCTINASSGQPYCRCPKLCQSVFAPVCGSDNVTYTSECHLNMASCQQQKRIQVERPGSCSDRDACADKQCVFGAFCVFSSDGIGMRCQCPDSCSSRGINPICGSDGKEYPNLCEMSKTSCTQMQNIEKKYDGRCDPCQGVNCKSGVCRVNANREPVCRCEDLNCPTEFEPICASDGQTYNSECVMKKESCISRKKITRLFAGKCLQGFDPCHGIKRKPYAECLINNGKREYVCPGNCEPIIHPVCGNDRKTYDNECLLKSFSCTLEKLIAVTSEGFCSESNPCSMLRCRRGATCSVINSQPSCVCPPCAQEFDPVCGSNGISYASECLLKAESCERNEDIYMQHKGLCSTCENKCDFYAVCQLDSQNIAKCICPTFCVEVEDQVCGTDGMIYKNECELRVASCATQKPIAVASEDFCDMCANVKCRHGGRCEKGKCVCPHHCPDVSDPICASNGVTYANDCIMHQTGCLLSMDLEVVQSGECDDQSGSGDGLGDGCHELTCQYGGFCAVNSSGFPECKCNFTCPALRQTVCGSDGRTYGSECLMRETSCKMQMEITEQPEDNCEDIFEEMCEGAVPLIDPVTLKDYNCTDNWGICPSGSYCHKTTFSAKCCQEDRPVSSCKDTAFGCCADNTTVAPGPHKAGCPGFCQCDPLGSLGATCDPISRQCTCKPGIDGLRCHRCHPGHWHLPMTAQGNGGCLPCDCSPLGSLRDDCDQLTGRCLCRQGFSGPKCNVCLSGEPLGPQGCPNESNNSSFSSCEGVGCTHGAVCQMQNGIPQCICTFVCPHNGLGDAPLSVCGSNQETYGSTCQLQSFACRTQQNISVTFQGHCSGGEINQPANNEVVVETTTEPPFTMIQEKYARLTYNLLTASHLLPITSLHLEHSTPAATPSAAMTQRHHLDRSRTAKNRIYDTTKQRKSNAVPFASKSTLGSAADIFTTAADKNFRVFSTPLTIPAKERPAFPNGASFMEKSYLQLNRSVSGNPNLAIELMLIPESPDGILFYAGQFLDNPKGDFVSLALRGGFVEFRYNLGSGPALLTSLEQVTMNQMNRVLGQRSSKDGLLRLNDFAEVLGSSKGNLTILNLGNSSIYLGSVPATKDVLLKQTGMEIGFRGCIGSLKVSESIKVLKLYDLTYPGSPDVVQGSLSDQHCSSFLKPDPSPCDSNPCESEGTCQSLATNNYTCICPNGRGGQRCEKVSPLDRPVSFDGFTYLAYDNSITKPQYAELSNRYEVRLRTNADKGLLLLLHNGKSAQADYLAIAINHGRVEASVNLGSENPSHPFFIRSTKQIDDDQWHTVLFIRNKVNVLLSVDDEVPVMAVLSPGVNQLDTDGKLWIGGNAVLPNHLPKPYRRGFKGCISSVKIDNRSLHLVEDRKTKDPLAFCTDP